MHNFTAIAVIRINSIIMTVQSSSLRITFQRINSESFQVVGSASTINTPSSSSSTSTDNLIAYRPSYSDPHRSNLGTIFINLDAIYPCIATSQDISCKLFPNEDDGFRGGKAILEAMDDNSAFGSGSPSFSFAFATCSQISYSCISTSHRIDLRLVCILPSSRCSNAP